MPPVPPKPDPKCHNIVSWALSGTYDADQAVLIDACNVQRQLSKNTAANLIARLAGAFAADSTVCLHLANDVLYPVLCMAIFASHCRWTGTNTAYTAPELEHHFRASQTRYVITAEEHLETVRTAVGFSNTQAEIILFTDVLFESMSEGGPAKCCSVDSVQPFRTLHQLLRNQSPEDLSAAIRDIDRHSIATLMPTSGTTGRPKMAARSHDAMVLEAAAIEDHHWRKPYEVRRLYCTPMFHGFSAPDMIINSLRFGFPAFYMRRFDDLLFPQKIQQHGITETFAPPPMILRLAKNPNAEHLLRSLRILYTGGAPLAPELRANFVTTFASDPPEIVQVWGMTEGGWMTTFKYPENHDFSVGRPVPGFEIKIGPAHRLTLSNGQEMGELYVKGPQVMSRYWNNKAETQQAFDGRWLRTGDIGYVKDGKVYVVDRAKDLIKVNGWQVSPVEIEDALLVSPHVKDVGVISIGADVFEHPLAFVVLADGSGHVTEAALKEHLFLRLARYKVASCEIRYIDAVPRSVSGKILKNKLRMLA